PTPANRRGTFFGIRAQFRDPRRTGGEGPRGDSPGVIAMSEETLFIEALGISDASRRAEFLDRECASDAALRDRLGRLLEQHERAGGFLGRPAIARLLTGADGAFAETVPSGPTDGPGTSVGPYKLLQKLGEGGMGHVWMAEQSHPVQRKVAVKLVKAGVD